MRVPATGATDRDRALAEAYRTHYGHLVRLAAFLTDRDEAEEVVQDAFVQVYGGWARLRDPDRMDAYLRATVVNLSRSRLRRRKVAAGYRPAPMPDAASAETEALGQVDREAVLAALRRLPARQREVIVLRYYADLDVAQTAQAMRCSTGSVKSHTSRAMSALRPLLEERS